MTSPNKILIVDDEPLLKSIILQKFKNQIKSKEMVFVFANNGVEALERLKEDLEIGVIFTDINMPEMDGLVLLGNLMQQNRLYRTVVVSAYSDLTNIRTAMNRGASDFITKPVNLNDLEITLTKTLDQFLALKKGAVAQRQMLEMQNELKIASNIQRAFIPHDFNPFPNNHKLIILGEMIPAKEVGGDFFDFFPINPTNLGMIMADVSGKGVPAALFMAMCRALLRATALSTASTSECLRHVNHLLCADNDSCMFVTTFYAILDIETGLLRYCNGGHNPPYLLGSDGALTQFGRAEGIALGAYDDFSASVSQYVEKTLQLKKDDTLILYTDGVTEATNRQNELYDERRLEEFLKKCANKPLPQIIQDLKDDIKAFIGDAEQSDDITLLLLRYCP